MRRRERQHHPTMCKEDSATKRMRPTAFTQKGLRTLTKTKWDSTIERRMKSSSTIQKGREGKTSLHQKIWTYLHQINSQHDRIKLCKCTLHKVMIRPLPPHTLSSISCGAAFQFFVRSLIWGDADYITPSSEWFCLFFLLWSCLTSSFLLFFDSISNILLTCSSIRNQ